MLGFASISVLLAWISCIAATLFCFGILLRLRDANGFGVPGLKNRADEA